jgi:hypothetical protein
MNLSRRTFLRGIITTTGALILPVTQAIPCILGDGIHDDGPGLNALINGRPVNILSEGTRILENGIIKISKGKFLIGETLVFENPSIITEWSDCVINPDKELNTIMDFRPMTFNRVENAVFKLVGGK